MPTSRPLLVVPILLLLGGLAGAALGSAARADEGPGTEVPPPPEIVDEVDVGVCTGNRVNLRVGPRVDNRAVLQLDEGAVLLVVEQRGDWVGVRIPGGFPVALSLKYVTREGPDVVRVAARKLNLRVHPPEEGHPAPAAFLDHPEPGALLTLIRIEEAPPVEAEGEAPAVLPPSGWAWVIAPEEIRAFVHKRYVKRLGPASEHRELVEAARAERKLEADRLAAARRREAARLSGALLMEEVGTVQQDLYRLRQSGGHDKTPVVALANRLDRALLDGARSPASLLRLARALREDLEREITLRVARHDAELAKLQGRNAPTIPPLEKVVEAFAQVGEIRYEPTPGWKEDGVFFLFVGGEPRYALRLTIGGPLPHPDFKAHAGAGPRKLEGRLSGDRLFGLPIFEVRALTVPK